MTAKNTAEIAPAAGMTGIGPSLKFLAGEALYSALRVTGNSTAAIITVPQTTSSTSMKVRNATALNAISHMNTTAPTVETAIATIGVCRVSLTKPSLSGATRSNDQAIMLRVVYAISAGIQNQIHAAKVARITTDRKTLWPRMPARTANHGAVGVVAGTPESVL